MSGCGRRAALEQDVARGRKPGFNARLWPRLGKDLRQEQCRRTGRHQRAGQLDQRADRAEVMGKPAWFLLRGDGGRVWRRQGLRLREADQRQAQRGRLEAVQMHVSEGQYELDGQRFGPNRNAPCYCGSGKKLKKCCGSEAQRTARVIDPRFQAKVPS